MIQAFAALFKEIIRKTVAVFNLHDNCSLYHMGRCAKCDKRVAAILAQVYIIIAEYATEVGAPLYFVSLAGKSFKVEEYLASRLRKHHEFFKSIFCGYHLSLYTYCNLWAFRGSYRSQIEKVSADVRTLLDSLDKPECYQAALDNVTLMLVRDLSKI
jgi:hypothetical protein